MKLIHSKAELLQQPEGLEGVYKMIEIAGRTCYKSEDKITEDSAKGFVERMIKSNHIAMLEHGTVYLYLKVDPSNAFKKFEYPLTGFTAHYNWSDVAGNLWARYNSNKYSKAVHLYESSKDEYFITTNMRVIKEEGWEDDLQFICEPTEHHEKRYTVKLTTDQGILRELTRHRAFSWAVESTRYCNYSKDKYGNELTYIIPSWVDVSKVPEKSIVSTDDWGDLFCEYYFNPSEKAGFEESTPEEHLKIALEVSEKLYMSLLNKGCSPQQARQVLPLATKCDVVMTGFVSDWRHFFDLRLFGKTGKPHPDMEVLADKARQEFIKANVYRDIMSNIEAYEALLDTKVP